MRMAKSKEQKAVVKTESAFYAQVRDVFVQARQFVHKTANFAMVKAYWLVGKMIVEKQGGEPGHHGYSQQYQRIGGLPLHVDQIAHDEQEQVPRPAVACGYRIVEQEDEREQYDEVERVEYHTSRIVTAHL